MYPIFAIIFSIDQLGGGVYGSKAWEIVWRHCDPEKAVGAMLFEGDSSATLQGLENVYACAFYGLDEITQSQFQSQLDKQKPNGYLRCDTSIFLAREPLRICGSVTRTAQGIEIDESSGSGWAKEGLIKTRRRHVTRPTTHTTATFTGLCPKCGAQIKVEIVGQNCDLSWVRCHACREDLHYQVCNGVLTLKKASDTARERATKMAAKIREMKERVKKATAGRSRKWWQFWR
jgi:transcription elongation factor Elf1